VPEIQATGIRAEIAASAGDRKKDVPAHPRQVQSFEMHRGKNETMGETQMHAEVRDEAFVGVVGADVRVEQVATSFGFTEGPVWDKARSQLIWSDMQHDHMRSWSAARGIRTYRKPSRKANGNTYDAQGRLVSCEHATSRVVREESDDKLTVLA
jgi:hypothetical protein